MDRQHLIAIAFADELQKIAATVLMKQLSPVAKKFMQRMTGTTRRASIPQAPDARRLRHALTGKGSPELMTEMHGMGKMLSGGERQALQSGRKHFERVLQQQGKVYKGVPGLERRLAQAPGHSRQLTRTGTGMGGPGTRATVASGRARSLRAPALGATIAAPARTSVGGPAAMRAWVARPNAGFTGGGYIGTAPTMVGARM